MRKIRQIDEAVFGPEHPNVARDVNNLGSVLQDLGDLPAARAVYKRALRIDEAVFGSEHPLVAIRVNNLGLVLRDLGDLAGARAAFDRALRIDEAKAAIAAWGAVPRTTPGGQPHEQQRRRWHQCR